MLSQAAFHDAVPFCIQFHRNAPDSRKYPAVMFDASASVTTRACDTNDSK